MEELKEYRQRLINRFAETPGLIEMALSKLNDIQEPLEPDGWNPHQVITHIRDVNTQVYLPRLQRIIKEDDPVFENFDADAWLADHYDHQEPMEVILAEIDEQCQNTVNWLGTLPGSDWNRVGTHPSIGRHTFQWWLERTVVHINEHLTQLGVSYKNPNGSME